MVAASVDRHQLYAMQTPQIFEWALIEEAYRAVFANRVSVTDEVSAVERLGRKVLLVPTEDFNFKITYPRDLALAEFVLKQRMQSACIGSTGTSCRVRLAMMETSLGLKITTW